MDEEATNFVKRVEGLQGLFVEAHQDPVNMKIDAFMRAALYARREWDNVKHRTDFVVDQDFSDLSPLISAWRFTRLAKFRELWEVFSEDLLPHIWMKQQQQH
jgi:hypothetical protein